MREQVPYVTPMIIFDLEREDKGRKLRAKRVKKMQRGEKVVRHTPLQSYSISAFV